jgi:aerobic-type carbon monoxide dehydrogenase small subunit (CoxS/CutS family)
MNGPITIVVNGEKVSCASPITVAALLISKLGTHQFRKTGTGKARGIFCGMGTCFDCLVTIDGQENVRACMTHLKDGMRIETS